MHRCRRDVSMKLPFTPARNINGEKKGKKKRREQSVPCRTSSGLSGKDRWILIRKIREAFPGNKRKRKKREGKLVTHHRECNLSLLFLSNGKWPFFFWESVFLGERGNRKKKSERDSGGARLSSCILLS